MNIIKSLNLKYNELYEFPNYIFQDFEVVSNSDNSYKPELIRFPVSILSETGKCIIWYNDQKTQYDFNFTDNVFTLDSAIDLKLQNFKVDNKPDNITDILFEIIDVEYETTTYETVTETVNINGEDLEISNEVKVINTEIIKTLIISKQLESMDQTINGRIQIFKE